MSFFLLLKHSNSLDLLLLGETVMQLYAALSCWEQTLPLTLFMDSGYGCNVCLQEAFKADENEWPSFLCSNQYREPSVVVGNHRK